MRTGIINGLLATTLAVLTANAPTAACAATVVLQQGVNGYTGTTDTTIFEEVPGNSAGGFPNCYAGMTKFSDARRTLIRFDLDGAVPPGSTITSVSLQLHVDRAQFQPIPIDAHRLTRAWNEGNNPKPLDNEGGFGAPALAGDTTWSHVSYNTLAWSTPGGEFTAVPSGSSTVLDSGTDVTLTGAGMVTDVTSWFQDPGSNHGWILLAGESGTYNAKRFISSESTDSRRPRLEITYSGVTAAVDWELFE